MKTILVLIAVPTLVGLIGFAILLIRQISLRFMSSYPFTIKDQKFTSDSEFRSLEALIDHLKQPRQGQVPTEQDASNWIFDNMSELLPHLVEREFTDLLFELRCGVRFVSVDDVLKEIVNQKKGEAFFRKFIPSIQTPEEWRRLLEKVQTWACPHGCPGIEKYLRKQLSHSRLDSSLDTNAIPEEKKRPGWPGVGGR